MVEPKKLKFAVIPGGLSEQDMKSAARRAHSETAARCALEIHEIIERMAARTANPELFRERMVPRHFNMPITPDAKKRREQLEVALDKMRKFEEDFDAYRSANGFRAILLPEEKIVSTVEHIAQSAWSGFRPIYHGRKSFPPPDSA